MNYDLAHGSVTSVSLEMHFTIPTRSGRSLPHFIQPFAQPVHYSLEEEDEDTDEDDYFEQEDEWSQKCAALVKVLDAFTAYGYLRSFTWIWEEGWMEFGHPEVPSEVYAALVKNGTSLESLNVDIPCAELGVCYPSWVSSHLQ